MNAIDLLLQRQSQPRLQSPAPTGEALEIIKQAAMRAPDHACLAPWQFIIFEGENLPKLGQIFEQSAIHNEADDTARARALQLPLRAPMVIVAATRYQENPKVPWIEQVESAACAVHAMQMAAFAQGFGAIWRTGSYAQCDVVKGALGIDLKDELVGFLYIGSTPLAPRERLSRDVSDHFTDWQG